MSSVKNSPKRPRIPNGDASPTQPAAVDGRAGRSGGPRVSRTLLYGLAGSGLLWAAQPPLNAWPLAWLAPIPWLILVRHRSLTGRRPYVALWLAGCCFWLAALHWLRLPHPATSLGWVALSLYLGIYLPLFVGLSRVAVHRWRCPVALAAPVVWVGLELAQARLLSGFSMAGLAHTQHRWLELIQISDLAGAYAVSFVLMCSAACLARIVPLDDAVGGLARRWSAAALWPLLPLAVVLGSALAYGHLRLRDDRTRPGPKVALIQGSIDTEMKHDPTEHQRIHDQYFELSRRAGRQHPDLDLIVWPETMFRDPFIVAGPDARLPAEWTGSRESFDRLVAQRQALIESQALLLGAPLLLGLDTLHFDSDAARRYNSALFIDRGGRLGPRYDKMHRVMFGEFVPLANHFPWLYKLTPLGGGLDAGGQPEAFDLGSTRLAANICFESTVPHFIRSQVAMLARRGQEPDVLVNLTNDGWFWGSSELDQHLACAVFRAVECRKPFLIAANTGFSAWIDADGRILRRGPRRDTGIIVADVRLDGRSSRYLHWGDWPAAACLAACLGLLVSGLVDRRRTALPAS